MWIFAAWGYLLPTITPDDDKLRNEGDWDHYSVNGQFTFQIRARLSEHLDWYIEHYAEEGTYGPIWRTPAHDYNFRIMTTQEAFAEAIKKSILDIDYRHFKDQSLKYPRGEDFHKLLINIWSASCNLNEPGGPYGPYSDENPLGYSPAWKYGYGRDNYDEYDGRRIGETFGIFENSKPKVTFEFDDDEEDHGWLTDADRTALTVIDEMYDLEVPPEDWFDFTSPGELAKVVAYLKRAGHKKTVKRIMKGASRRLKGRSS